MRRAAVAAAAVRLRDRRLLAAAFGAAGLFAVASTFFSLQIASERGQPTDEDFLSLSELEASSGLGELIGAPVMVMGAITVATAAWLVASEFTGHVIGQLLVRMPWRRRLIGGYWMTMVGFVVALSFFAAAATTLTGVAAAEALDVDSSGWSTAAGLGDAAAASGQLILCLIGFATIGMGLALLLRSAAAAIGIALIWGLFEGLLEAALGGVFQWFPGQALGAIATGGNESVSLALALPLSAIWIAALAAWSLRDFERGDVLV